MKKILFTIALIALLAAACSAPATPVDPAPEPTGTPMPSTPAEPEPTDEPAPTEPGPAESADAVAAALAQLAEALGVPVDQIVLAGVEAVEWPDSCLGISYPNARCAQAITPGFRLQFEAAGRRYQVHTNQDGTSVALAVPSLTWHREGGIAGFCDDLFVNGFGAVQASACGNNELTGELTEAEMAQLNAWAEQYSSVVIEMSDGAVADGMTLILTMNGAGTGQPNGAEQQAMLEWAQAVYTRLTT